MYKTIYFWNSSSIIFSHTYTRKSRVEKFKMTHIFWIFPLHFVLDKRMAISKNIRSLFNTLFLYIPCVLLDGAQEIEQCVVTKVRKCLDTLAKNDKYALTSYKLLLMLWSTSTKYLNAITEYILIFTVLGILKNFS